MAISEDVSEEYTDVSHSEDLPQENDHNLLFDPLEVELLISLNSLTSISAPQTLKLIGYLKHRKVIILVEAPIILFIAALPKRQCAMYVQSTIFKS
jgi:hypothetical protein